MFKYTCALNIFCISHEMNLCDIVLPLTFHVDRNVSVYYPHNTFLLIVPSHISLSEK